MAVALDQPRAVSATGYFPVAIESLDAAALTLDLHLRHAEEPVPALYRASGVPFTEDDRRRLIEQGIRFLYVPQAQMGLYRKALAHRLETVFNDPDMRKAERATVIRKSCARLIEDVFTAPVTADSLQGVFDLSERFAHWSRQDAGAFSYLLDMSEHDFYTATHMLNVGVGCGMLAAKVCADNPDLARILIEGGLIHDVGKRGVPEGILNKEGKLEPHEWELVKRHPVTGYDELKEHGVDEVILAMTRDHHERLDGKGYPGGLQGDQITLPARICAVVDVFDAITAARPYRGPTHPLETLKIMSSGVGTQFDERVFEAWKNIIEAAIESDSARAPQPRVPGQISLDALAQPSASTDIDAGDRPAALEGANRRRHPRHPCLLPIECSFLRVGKPLAIALGEPYPCHALDISQGGLLLRTPWPLTRGDIVRIRLVAPGAAPLERHGEIVRVRKGQGDAWLAGVRFIVAPPQN